MSKATMFGMVAVLSFLGCHSSDQLEMPPMMEPALTPVVVVAPSTQISISSCPADMTLVQGNYCPEVIQNCKKWIDLHGGIFEFFRCAKYAPATCKSEKRIPMRFCIDTYEYIRAGEKLPEVNHSWTTAKKTCEDQGKRLCMESEWQFACEGPESHPYPYGDGLTRDATACNIDRQDLGKPNSGLKDNRVPTGSNPKCVSPFGIYDMSGNVEEWATIDGATATSYEGISTMKGAWWLPGRNTCRARTTRHGEDYQGKQVGIRCCADAK